LFRPSRTGSFEFNQNFFLVIEAGRHWLLRPEEIASTVRR